MWILWAALLQLTVLENQDNGITKEFVSYLCATIAFFAFFVFLTVVISQEIQFTGAQKYMEKEIVIKKFNVQYDSQNQPIDTTYTFKYNK